MINYKIAFIGYGSIGKRHVENLKTVLGSKDYGYQIDLIRSISSKGSKLTKSDTIPEGINQIYYENEDIPTDYDIIFVTNPTNLHYDTVKKFSNHTKHMFIEKPVFDSLEVNLSDLNLKTGHVYYVACPLRYTNVIQYIKNKVNLNDVYSVRSICSSYLPEWRKGVDYRETYSAHKNQGGGVSIDLIHEWDYLMYLFGTPKQVYNLRGTFSNLEIDSDDLSVYIAKYPKLLMELHLDYFGRKNMREIQLFTKDDTIIADLTNSKIEFLKSNEIIMLEESRDDFQKREIETFVNIIEGKEINHNDIENALRTLKIAKEGKI